MKYMGVLLDEHMSSDEQIYQIKLKLNRAIGILSKLRSHANVNTLRIAYYSLFQSHLQYGVQLWGQKNQEIKEIIQKLQNPALRKINFKKFHHPIKHIYKGYKILKFGDILKIQNCVFMCQFEQNNALAISFLVLHSKDKHNYQTRSGTQNLLDVPLARTNKYGEESVKYQCIRDWNNFKKKFPQIPENKLSYMKIKRILKQAIFDQY